MTIREAAALVLKRYYGGQVRNDNDVTEYQVAAHLGTVRNFLMAEAMQRTKGVKLQIDEGVFTRYELVPVQVNGEYTVELPSGYMDSQDLLSIVVRPAARFIMVPESWIDEPHRLLNLEGNTGYCITPDGKLRFAQNPGNPVKVDVVDSMTPQTDIDGPFKIPSDMEAQAIEMTLNILKTGRMTIDKSNDGADRP